MAGAVSGNGTQTPTYAEDPTELAGIVDTGFNSGDRAYVNSLRPNGRFYLDRDSVAVADNVLVINTWSGFGRWLVEPGGGAVGAPLFTNNQAVAVPGQVAFVLPSLPSGAVIMFVNGVQYREGIDYTVVGLNVTWLVPFVLAPPDTVTFAYN